MVLGVVFTYPRDVRRSDTPRSRCADELCTVGYGFDCRFQRLVERLLEGHGGRQVFRPAEQAFPGIHRVRHRISASSAASRQHGHQHVTVHERRRAETPGVGDPSTFCVAATFRNEGGAVDGCYPPTTALERGDERCSVVGTESTEQVRGTPRRNRSHRY